MEKHKTLWKKYDILMKNPNPVESPNTMNPLKLPGNDPSNECEYSCIFILMGGSSQLYYSTKLAGSGRFSTAGIIREHTFQVNLSSHFKENCFSVRARSDLYLQGSVF